MCEHAITWILNKNQTEIPFHLDPYTGNNIQTGADKSCHNSNLAGGDPHIDINSLLLCNHHYNRCPECEHALNVNSGEIPY
jgi:hypothetical protein